MQQRITISSAIVAIVVVAPTLVLSMPSYLFADQDSESDRTIKQLTARIEAIEKTVGKKMAGQTYRSVLDRLQDVEGRVDDLKADLVGPANSGSGLSGDLNQQVRRMDDDIKALGRRLSGMERDFRETSSMASELREMRTLADRLKQKFDDLERRVKKLESD